MVWFEVLSNVICDAGRWAVVKQGDTIRVRCARRSDGQTWKASGGALLCLDCVCGKKCVRRRDGMGAVWWFVVVSGDVFGDGVVSKGDNPVHVTDSGHTAEWLLLVIVVGNTDVL